VFHGLRAGLDVLVYWSLVGVCQAITNFRRSQERERRAAELEARLTSAKLQALRMQINPHFLFNTLNSIAALVYVNPRAADEMLGDLSELLRRSLDSMEEQEIPLAQELEFIGAYISIQQKRFGERLRVELELQLQPQPRRCRFCCTALCSSRTAGWNATPCADHFESSRP